jgi:hypothetical protein
MISIITYRTAANKRMAGSYVTGVILRALLVHLRNFFTFVPYSSLDTAALTDLSRVTPCPARVTRS